MYWQLTGHVCWSYGTSVPLDLWVVSSKPSCVVPAVTVTWTRCSRLYLYDQWLDGHDCAAPHFYIYMKRWYTYSLFFSLPRLQCPNVSGMVSTNIHPHTDPHLFQSLKMLVVWLYTLSQLQSIRCPAIKEYLTVTVGPNLSMNMITGPTLEGSKVSWMTKNWRTYRQMKKTMWQI